MQGTYNMFAGFEVLTELVMNSFIFWDITPCGPLKVNRRFGGIALLAICCKLFNSNMQMKATYFFDKLTDFPWTT
jgi:hypothetical protein